jgi:hypothetical protein
MRRMETANFWIRVVLAITDLSVLALLIYDTVFHPGAVTRRELLWQALAVISLTAALVMATLHRPSASNAFDARQSRAAAESN